MSLELFKVVEHNPNEDIGGGGCVCSPEQETSYCKGPFVVFYASETSEHYSPHVVVCQKCIDAASEALGLEDAEIVLDDEDEDGEELNL